MSEAVESNQVNNGRPRRWRWLKITGLVVLATIGVGMIWFAVASWRASAHLNAKLAEFKAEGVPLSLAELERTPPPPEENAATYLRRAVAGLDAIQSAISGAEDQLSGDEQARYWEQGETTAALQQVMREAFAEHPETIPLLLRAAAAPDYDPQINYDQPPGAFLEEYLDTSQDVRQPIRVLNYYVVMQLNDGKQSEATEACIAMFQLSRHFDARPLLMGYLVNLAVRGVAVHATDLTLRAGALPEEAYDSLEAELARQDFVAGLRTAIRTEPAYVVSAFEESPFARTETASGANAFDQSTFGGNAYLRTPLGKDDLTDYLQLLEELEKRAAAPPRETQAWLETLRLGPLAQMMIPMVQASFGAQARLTAQVHCLRVLIALTKRSPEKPGAPVSVTELGLPADATIDPYNGKPLNVRYEPGGWLVYSVGANGKDDGGKIRDWSNGDYLDVGLGPVSGPVGSQD